MWGCASHSLRVLVLLLAALCAPRAANAAAHPISPAAAPAKAAALTQHRHRHDLAPAAAARAPPVSPAHPDIGPGGVNVTALLLGGNFDVGSIITDGPLVDPICASPLCVKLCRDTCHALTAARLSKLAVRMPANKTDDELAASIYAPDVVLLVTPIAVLVGSKIALEYVTTFSRPSSIPTVANLTKVTVNQYAQAGDVITTGFDLHLTNPLNASLSSVLRGVQQLKFNEKSRITHQTIEYPTRSWSFEKLDLPATITPANYQTFLYDNICNAHEQYCTGDLKQYANKTACISFLSSRPALPPLYTLAGDNSYCRLFHAKYVPLLPEVHCSHIGPTGGGQCTDDVPFTPEKADEFFPTLTFFSAPAAIAPLIRSQLPLP